MSDGGMGIRVFGKFIAASVLSAAVGMGVASGGDGIPERDVKWTWAGWGGGGYFWTNAFDPQDADVIYLGGDVAGVYKSTDRGATWKIINNGIHNYGIYGMAVAPSDPDVVYVMTTDGMARTDNGGGKWTPLPETMRSGKNISANRPGSVRPIAVHPNNPMVLFSGNAGGDLFKSEDGGVSWSTVDYLAPLREANAGKPSMPAASGAGFLWLDMNAPAGDWKNNGRIERYYDIPQDWSEYSGMSAKIYVPSSSGEVHCQLVVQSGPGWAWQASRDFVCKPGQWTDVDFDLSGISSPKDIKMAHVMLRSNGVRIESEIGVDAVKLIPRSGGAPKAIGEWDLPGNTDGWRVTKSSDGTLVKKMRTSHSETPVKSAPVGSVAVAAKNPDLIFVANRKNGVFRSADGGRSWSLCKIPAGASCVTVHPADARIVYAALEGNGVYASTDGGITWKKKANPRNDGKSGVREIVCDPRNTGTIHAIGTSGWNGFIAKSTDGGETWSVRGRFARDVAANPTVPKDGSMDKASGRFMGGISSVRNLAVSPSEPDVLFVAANWNNMISTDGGESWRESIRGADITCFHDLRIFDGKVYGAAMDEGLLVSDDDGASWRQLTPVKYTEGLSGHQWRVNVSAGPDGVHRVVSTVSPWRASAVYPNGVLVSSDGGKTFSRATGLPDFLPTGNTAWENGFARALATDPSNPMVMYLGIDGDKGGGVFKSADGGLSWKRLDSQPGSLRMFYGIAVDPSDSRRIYWGCCKDGGGVWRSDDGGASWVRTSLPDEWIFNVEIAPSGTVYAGGNGLWRSDDHGATWKKLTNVSGYTFTGIAVDPENERRIWTSAVTWDGSSRGMILESVDGGASWTDICGDIGYRKPLVLRYDPVKKNLWAAGVCAFKTRR